MNEMTAHVVFDPTRRDYAERLADAISGQLRRLIQEAAGPEALGESDVPSLRLREGIDALPPATAIGPMDLVLLILPDRAFTAPEAALIAAFEAAIGGERRLLPVAMPGVKSVPPAPLDGYVSAPGDVADPLNIKQLAAWLLIQFFLRARSSGKSVFISYRMSDGKAAAALLAKKLAERSYNVFLDEKLDDDLQKSLEWGSQAQESLAERINRQGALLLVDTPEAVQSRWVRIEVETAHARLKPIFPVVLHPKHQTYEAVGIGGRFPINRGNQVGIPCPYEALTPEGVAAAFHEEFLDELVIRLGKQIAEHLHVMRYLIRSTNNQFRNLEFQFREVDGDRLHVAWAERHHASTPGLCFRFLVKVSPYKSLVAGDVEQMKALLRDHAEHCQYGLLVQRGLDLGGFETLRDELLVETGGHLMVLAADEIRGMAKRLLVLESRT